MSEHNGSSERLVARLEDIRAEVFDRYRPARPSEREQAACRIIAQLGPDRARRWAGWATELGRALNERTSPVADPLLGLPLPPEPPSALVDDLARLKDEVARDLLISWAQLARVLLEEAPTRN